ncbi:unnamed protein product [Pseudo-nitzschia multistriata]|uniref:GAF domain-containing protein n=1 Tax=Pseudo-nitzschia multistriata TaxID=183589 RepID=A0A448ZIF3_9STRA|nr:unnamed protein product [Pseudo-nitzschia multistriata]
MTRIPVSRNQTKPPPQILRRPANSNASRNRHLKRTADGARRSKATDASVIVDKRTLRWVAFTTSLPFVGFGFMDNFILIIAGDYIDASLGVTLGISTMCAAAIGNIVSDVAGIGCAASIENFCATTLNLPVPELSHAQRQLRSVRFASQGGMAIGMTIGCVLGMVPLLFIDSTKADRLKKKARLERLCLDVVNEAKSLVGAESTCLYLRVDEETKNSKKSASDGILPGFKPSVEGDYLYAKYYVEPPKGESSASSSAGRTSPTKALIRMVSNGIRATPHKGSSEAGDAPESNQQASRESSFPTVPHPVSSSRIIPVGKGIISRAVLTGTTWNISGNLMDEPDFYPLSIETGTIDAADVRCNTAEGDHRFRDCAVVPIRDAKGNVIAVLQALNKQRCASSTEMNSSAGGGFTDQDVEILKSLASHVSVTLQRILLEREGEDDDLGLKDTIRILKEGKGTQNSNTPRWETSATTTTNNSSPRSEEHEGSSRGNQNTTANTIPATGRTTNSKLFPEP